MNWLKRPLCLLFALILSLNILTVGVLADDTFIDNENWREISATEATTMYNNDKSFVVMYYRNGCFNSSLRKVMIDEWMTTYDTVIYGVDVDAYSIPYWVWDALGEATSVTLPVICIVENGVASAYSGADSMRTIQKRFSEYLGVYDDAVISFDVINETVYDAYAVSGNDVEKYRPDPAYLEDELYNAAQSIVSGCTTDAQKLKAIYNWVTENIYYNYGMLDGSYTRKVSAYETYSSRNSVCEGYANLTAAFCHAVGIPCRVVVGFATGVGASETVPAVWARYKQYCSDKNLTSFTNDIIPYANHAWNEAFINGRWVILDTTWGSNNDYYPDSYGRITGVRNDDYYDPDLEWFSETHLFWGTFRPAPSGSSSSEEEVPSGSVSYYYSEAGTTLRFSFGAADRVSYTWYYKDFGASKFVKASTESTYSFELTEATSGRQFYCIATTSEGESVSSVVIEARVELEITKEPTGSYVSQGAVAKTTVSATGAGLKYTWYIKDPGASKFSKSSITSATYSFKMTAAKSGRQVYCVITDRHGETVTTDVATLRMKATVTVQPKTAYAAEGSVAKTTVTAVGDGLTYTWYIKDPGASKFSKSSVTSATYSFRMSAAKSGRQAYCVIKDKYGNSVTTETVYMRSKAAITTQPKTTYAQLGKVAKTTVTATGDGLTYTWYIKNPGATKFTKSSIKSSTYSLKMTEDNAGRQVYCIVKDKYGNTVKTATVELRLRVTVTAQPTATPTAIGKVAKTTVTAVGDGLTYTWYIKDPGASKFSKSSITSATYSFKMTAAKSGRQVYCVIKDKYGYTVTTATVTLAKK